MKRIFGIVASFALVIMASILVVQPVQAAAPTQSVAFPMYEYPTLGTLWDDVYGAGSQVSWIIANPGTGPGLTVDPIYTTYLNNKPSGTRVTGYVNLGYHSQPMSQVVKDIDDWYVMYPQISGIFFDLLKNGAAPADVCYAATAYNYVKSKHPNDLAVMNPGTNIEMEYEPYGDIFANAENTYAVYSNWQPFTDGFENNPAYFNRFWHIVHTASAGQLNSALSMTRANNAGWVLVTDRLMPNPYNAVPTYWSTFLSGVATLPQTPIPNRGLTGMPAGCLEMSLNMSRTVSAQTKQVTNTITNTAKNIDATRFNPGATKVSYTLPSGVTFASVSGTGWNCTINGSSADCVNSSQVPANTDLPTVSAAVAVGCNYTSGQVGVTLTTFAGDTVATQSAIDKPADCIDPVIAAPVSGAAGGAVAAANKAKVATTTTQDQATSIDTQVVEESTVTTESETSRPPVNSYTPPTETAEESTTEASGFNIVPVGFGIVAAILIGLGIWWLIARRRKSDTMQY